MARLDKSNIHPGPAPGMKAQELLQGRAISPPCYARLTWEDILILYSSASFYSVRLDKACPRLRPTQPPRAGQSPDWRKQDIVVGH
jgi:hypothetical protein